MKRLINNFSKYFVDSEGQIYSTKRGTERVLKPRTNSRGYSYVNLCENGKYKSKMVHRIVAETFLPNSENFPIINHINGNKLDNRVKNLEWCTYSHNTREAVRLGLLVPRKGNESNLSSKKLSVDIANNIREEFKNSLTNPNKSYNNLAAKYEVSKATIIQIIKLRIYN